MGPTLPAYCWLVPCQPQVADLVQVLRRQLLRVHLAGAQVEVVLVDIFELIHQEGDQLDDVEINLLSLSDHLYLYLSSLHLRPLCQNPTSNLEMDDIWRIRNLIVTIIIIIIIINNNNDKLTC